MIQTAKLATLGEMASMVTHELARPITNIGLEAELNLSESDSSEELINYSQNVLNEIRRCNSIIRSLQTFGRDSNNSPKDKKDTNQIIEETLQLTKPYLSFTEVVKELEEDLPEIICNSIQMEQVFSNLLINAKDALPGNASDGITIRSYKQDKKVVIEVEDKGEVFQIKTIKRYLIPFLQQKLKEKEPALDWRLLNA